MQLTTVKLDPTRILYTIPIHLVLTEKELHIANSASCSRRTLFDVIVAFVDYQYVFCNDPTQEMVMPQLESHVGPKAGERLYNVVTTASRRLSRLMPEDALELAVMGFSRRSIHVLATVV